MSQNAPGRSGPSDWTVIALCLLATLFLVYACIVPVINPPEEPTMTPAATSTVVVVTETPTMTMTWTATSTSSVIVVPLTPTEIPQATFTPTWTPVPDVPVVPSRTVVEKG